MLAYVDGSWSLFQETWKCNSIFYHFFTQIAQVTKNPPVEDKDPFTLRS